MLSISLDSESPSGIIGIPYQGGVTMMEWLQQFCRFRQDAEGYLRLDAEGYLRLELKGSVHKPIRKR